MRTGTRNRENFKREREAVFIWFKRTKIKYLNLFSCASRQNKQCAEQKECRENVHYSNREFFHIQETMNLY